MEVLDLVENCPVFTEQEYEYLKIYYIILYYHDRRQTNVTK